MTRNIAIVGAGQSGLPLALALLARGDRVTLVSNRTPEDLRRGKVLSSQCMFDHTLQIERDFGLNQWEHLCPPMQGIGLTVPHPEQPGARLIDWAPPLDRYAQAVDQRVKMPAAWFVCACRDAIETGDHTLFIGRVEAYDSVAPQAPLVFHAGAFTALA